MAFEAILDPIFMPLININPPIIPITIFSLGITLLITFIYKWSTDQDLMKSLKGQMKKYQNEMKKLRDNPQEMMKVQKKAMQKNMEYMKHSMKSTLYTMVPIIIIFGYLNTHMGFFPIMPNQEFTVSAEFKEGTTGEIELLNPNLIFLSDSTQDIENGIATWKLKGDEGQYILEYKFNDKTYTQDLLITTKRQYERNVVPVKGGQLKSLHIGNEKVIALNLFGWKLGWLGTYIILSITFSTTIRKMLKIH